jgi:CHAD domain-containing protein
MGDERDGDSEVEGGMAGPTLAGARLSWVDVGNAIHTETEWQFDALDLRPVARWLEVRGDEHPGAVSPESTQRLTDRYLDTEDWRIYRAGYTLRIRSDGRRSEATLKALPGEGSVRRRVEITQAISDASVVSDGSPLDGTGPVGRRVRDVCGTRPLQPLFQVETTRRTYSVQAGGSRAELALDHTSIPVPGPGEPVQLRRIEVEVREGPPDGLVAFVRELESGTGLRPASLTKFQAGLLGTGTAPPPLPEFGPMDAGPSQTLGEVAFAALRRQFQAFLRTEPGTRIGDDPEDLHDMRVATRRMRAALSVFEEALPARGVRARQELGWIAVALGAVRDLDVQLEYMERWLAESTAEDGPGHDAGEAPGQILAALREAREAARDDLLRVLDSPRYARFVDSFTGMLLRGPLRAQSVAWKPVGAEAPRLAERRRRAVRKGMKKVAGAADREAALHKVRIRAKRLRYLLEFLADVYPQEVPDVVGRLVKTQDLLGVQQDAIVGSGRLRELALRGDGPLGSAAVFLLGSFAERYAEMGRQAVRRWSKRPSPVGGAAWKRLDKAMKRLQQQTLDVPVPPRMVLAGSVDPEASPADGVQPVRAITEA